MFDGFDPQADAVWMAESADEATGTWNHKSRIVFFLSAMRHFRDAQRAAGRVVHYHELSPDASTDRGADLRTILSDDLARLRPDRIVVVEPGEYRTRSMVESVAAGCGVAVDVLGDRSFYTSHDEFDSWASGRKSLVMEQFYRTVRKRHGILIDDDGRPEGGQWNYDSDNRESFGKTGPSSIPKPIGFAPDAITRRVIDLVRHRFPEHPGRIDRFDLPVTTGQAREALADFIASRLPDFGRYEDAMWTGEPVLYHSRLSAALNAKLIDARSCVDAAIDAYRRGAAPLNSVEGFVRQIVGWREFVRGVYWNRMPGYAKLNALECDDHDVPACFWTGETDMRCVSEAMRSLIDRAWTHHIERLMVLGQFALLSGVHPYRFHEWHMAMYVDAADWVSLPNALGMSQFGDGGVIATKPYCASGNYINRMSNYCSGCRYDPRVADGQNACPFTTLYWDFLARHRDRLASNHRMGFQLKNLERKPAHELDRIRARAATLRDTLEQPAAGRPTPRPGQNKENRP